MAMMIVTLMTTKSRERELCTMSFWLWFSFCLTLDFRGAGSMVDG
jgi:hypothetical protein